MATPFIIRTKLHRPALPADLIPRPALLERLERGCEHPIILVSAPAGYGKSTLLSSWAQETRRTVAWISLDEHDSDLRVFLEYVAAALEGLDEQAFRGIARLTRAPELPPRRVLVGALVNALFDFNRDLTLILDDYHLVRGTAVHDFTLDLLQFCPDSFCLGLAARHDPPLPLSTYRAKNRITEIRFGNLRFNSSEAAAFLETIGCPPEATSATQQLTERTEGWITGLRLVGLWIREGHDLGQMSSRLGSIDHYVAEYLVEQVLDSQSEGRHDQLLASAILERFCPSLCDAVFDESEGIGSEFIRWLEGANLFVIPLGRDREKWVRHHHLFRELLEKLLSQRHGDWLPGLHRRASRWFAEQGFVDEALLHATRSGDRELAPAIIKANRHEVVGNEEWPRLERWLALVPDDLIEQDPELLVLRAWSAFNRSMHHELTGILDKLDALLEKCRSDEPDCERIRGESHVLRGMEAYHAGDGANALAYERAALLRLPDSYPNERAFAMLMLGVSLQMVGELQQSYMAMHRNLEDLKTSGHAYGFVLAGLAFVQWMAGDLDALVQTSETMQSIGLEQQLPETQGVAGYFRGIVHYQRGELANAVRLLEPVAFTFAEANAFVRTHAAICLALANQALGNSRRAAEVASELVARHLETGNQRHLREAKAFEAEIALRQGRSAFARRWAESFDVGGFNFFYGCYVADFTFVKVKLSDSTPASRDQARSRLATLEAFFQRIHNIPWSLQGKILSAMLALSEGDQAAARVAVLDALEIAEPGGVVQPFIDHGERMARLLASIQTDKRFGTYVERIRQSCSAAEETAGTPNAGTSTPFGSSLTVREIEVLALLAERLSNKEIANKLSISVATAKRHVANVCEKLEAHGRRHAVAKAVELNVIPVRATIV